jgi:hypothetical protein
MKTHQDSDVPLMEIYASTLGPDQTFQPTDSVFDAIRATEGVSAYASTLGLDQTFQPTDSVFDAIRATEGVSAYASTLGLDQTYQPTDSTFDALKASDGIFATCAQHAHSTVGETRALEEVCWAVKFESHHSTWGTPG